MKQQTSFSELEGHLKIKATYGGSLLKGKRKSRRPLDSKKPVHLVLKTTNSSILLKNRTLIRNEIYRFSRKFGVKVHSHAIQHDHIHLNISFPSRRIYVMWIRALTGTLSKKVESLKFKFLPFTRLINSWGREFRVVQNYISNNQHEAEALVQIHHRIEEMRKKNIEELRIYAERSGACIVNL